MFRLYELAGAAHSGPFAAGQPAAADLTIAGYAAPPKTCAAKRRGDFPLGYAFNAIWQQYDDLLVRQRADDERAPHRGRMPGECCGMQQAMRRAAFVCRRSMCHWRAYRGRSTPRGSDARAQGVCALTGAMQKLGARS